MLVGRDVEQKALNAALADDRLVTLVGPGGVGKTALASATVSDRPEGSVLFVSLAPMSGEDVTEGVAGSLGFASFADLVAHARTKAWLIVLDNCEHVLDAAAELAEALLVGTERLKLLATSRERLDLDAERVIRLEPLSTVGSPSPAAELFRSAMARRGLEGAESSETIDELCRRLDGLPLALELAAARTTSLTAAEILDNLDEMLQLLARSRPRGPERHRSLAAAVGWSYEQLNDDARRLFTTLSVLGASFTFEMAASVSGLPEADTRSLLSTLVDRSLVVHEPIADSSWYRMLETIRGFAADQLTAPARRSAEDRLIAYVDGRAKVMGVDSVMLDARVPTELSRSLRTVFWAIEQAMERDDQGLAHRLVTPLIWMAEVGHQSETADVVQRVIDRWPDDDGPGVTICWGILSCLSLYTETREPSVGSVREAASAAARRAAAGEGIGAAYGERTLGQVERGKGNWALALDHYERAAEIARTIGQEGIALEVGLHAALTIARSDDMDAAIAQLEELLVASEGYHLAHAWAADFLGYVLLTRDPQRSAELAAEVLSRSDWADNGWLAASSLGNLAFAALMKGETDSAAQYVVDAIDAYRAIGNRFDITLAFLAAAAVFVQRGDEASAQGAMATERLYTDTAIGDFEAELLQRAGPLPERDPAVVPLDVTEIVRRLESSSALTDPSSTDAPEPATAAVDGRGQLGRGSEPAAAGIDGRGQLAQDFDSVDGTRQVDGRTPSVGASAANRFVLAGDVWEISYRGTTILQRRSKGLADLARLLESPGVELAALDLIDAGVVAGNSGPVSDAGARRQYQDRIRELQAEIEEAEDNHDTARAERAEREMDELVDQLSAAYGLGGRPRQDADPAEKARSAVTARIRSAIKRLEESHPSLGDHLARNVRTGRFCVYRPPEDVSWVTSSRNRG